MMSVEPAPLGTSVLPHHYCNDSLAQYLEKRFFDDKLPFSWELSAFETSTKIRVAHNNISARVIGGGQESLRIPAKSSEPSSSVRANRVATGVLRLSQEPVIKAPIEHIKFLASDALEGRDSPSKGLSTAAEYIISELKKFAADPERQQVGLVGANPAHEQNPFLQPFRVFSFDDESTPLHLASPIGDVGHGHRNAHTHQHEEFHAELFENGLFLEGLNKDDIELIKESIARRAEYNANCRTFARELSAATTTKDAIEVCRQWALKKYGSLELPERSAEIPSDVNHNVVGFLEGSDPTLKDEAIVISAHYDHIGKGFFGSIYNGADDNASGTAAALTAMQELTLLARQGKLKRSVAVVFTAAEEKGLLGMAYFARNSLPKTPIKKIKGYLNIDMVGRQKNEQIAFSARTKGEPNEFEEIIKQANGDIQKSFTQIDQNIDHYERRQDGWILNKEGIPGAFIFEGLDARGRINPDYHKPGDDVEKIDADKVLRASQLLVAATVRAANREIPPPSSNQDSNR